MNKFSTPVTMSLESTLEALDYDASRFAAIALVVVEDLPLLVEELRLAVADGNDQLALSMLNAIKGLASNFRADPLLRLVIAFDLAYSGLSAARKESFISEIRDACDGTVRALENAIESLSLST
jgi:hypothetical protein